MQQSWVLLHLRWQWQKAQRPLSPPALDVTLWLQNVKRVSVVTPWHSGIRRQVSVAAKTAGGEVTARGEWEKNVQTVREVGREIMGCKHWRTPEGQNIWQEATCHICWYFGCVCVCVSSKLWFFCFFFHFLDQTCTISLLSSYRWQLYINRSKIQHPLLMPTFWSRHAGRLREKK